MDTECFHIWKREIHRQYHKAGRLSAYTCVKCDEHRRVLKKKNGDVVWSQWRPQIIPIGPLEEAGLLHSDPTCTKVEVVKDE